HLGFRLRRTGRQQIAGSLRQFRPPPAREHGPHLLVDFRFQRSEARKRAHIPVRRIDESLLKAGAFEITGESVIVARADRVELVIVAAGAGNRLAEKRLAQRVELIVDSLGLLLTDIDRRLLAFEHPEEARGENRFVAAAIEASPRLRNEITGQMLDNKL